jgi:hypothetical protein
VHRGGNWRDDAIACRLAFRSGNAPDARRHHVGLRVCLVLADNRPAPPLVDVAKMQQPLGPATKPDAPRATAKVAAQQPSEVWLKSIKPEISSFYAGSTPGKIVVNGMVSENGIYAHPHLKLSRSHFKFALSPGFHLLTGWAGIADYYQDASGGKSTPTPRSPLVFKVVGDGETFWQSTMKKRGEAAPFKLDITGVAALELIAECSGSPSDAVWLEPQLSATQLSDSEIEKALKQEVQKATQTEAVCIAQRAVRLANRTEERDVMLSAKRIAMAAAKKAGSREVVGSIVEQLKGK